VPPKTPFRDGGGFPDSGYLFTVAERCKTPFAAGGAEINIRPPRTPHFRMTGR
jgi:hypothetical protein